MIKFRCPHCTQKIAANDEGAGVAIPCPTCRTGILVPRQTADEFCSAPSPPLTPVALEIVRGNPASPHDPGASSVRPAAASAPLTQVGVLPILARLMADKLVQTLLQQRRALIETQQNAAQQAEELEQRLEAIQQKWERRIQTYEHRISELQGALAAREQENQELATANMRLAHRGMELEKLKAAVEAESRDADLLLRA